MQTDMNCKACKKTLTDKLIIHVYGLDADFLNVPDGSAICGDCVDKMDAEIDKDRN